MESRGGCCIARCATGAYDMSKVDRIMLRFRPIAPKPGSTVSVSDSSSSENGNAFSRSAGTKRKHAKDNSGNKRGIRRRRTAPPPAVTLPLLPETPDPKDPPKTKSMNAPMWLSFENRGYSVSAKVDPPAAGLGGSVVTVECLTNTWQKEGEGEGLQLVRNDEERKVKMEKDTCPGFISDGYGRVTWTNGAYQKMVGEGVVLLIMKATVPYPYGGFTCRVRVQYACGKERTVPCDVWRLESGGFAWRLDVTAALSLSLAL
ncbi:hypothetical protein SESBI_32740 [Sesbania bispinosa]|nr:hypothetical protein SESBI_32740 [Sesbania bispinosa]